jgi:hypothetical protein
MFLSPAAPPEAEYLAFDLVAPVGEHQPAQIVAQPQRRAADAHRVEASIGRAGGTAVCFRVERRGSRHGGSRPLLSKVHQEQG